MIQIVVLSGKGGTGKTTITASLSYLFEEKVMVDADVDASNLHILFDLKESERTPYSGGQKAVIDKAKCTECGTCVNLCRFDAIHKFNGKVSIDPLRCEGCGVCRHFCPHGAVELISSQNGWLRISEGESFPLIDGELFPGEETSGGLVAVVRKKSLEKANDGKIPNIIIDGAPGIGCPVTSSITYTDLVILVTEPSLSGLQDLKRIVETVEIFKTRSLLIINKYDLNDSVVDELEKFANSKGIEIIGKIPYDSTVMKATRAGKSILSYDCPASREITTIHGKISEYLQNRVL